MAENLPPNEQPPVSTESGNNRNGAIFGGVALLLIGTYFLLQSMGITDGIPLPDNWWALFILIPAVASGWQALQAYNRSGEFTAQVRSQGIFAVIMFVVASVFLFDLDWGNVWPVFLIIGGLGVLMGAVSGKSE